MFVVILKKRNCIKIRIRKSKVLRFVIKRLRQKHAIWPLGESVYTMFFSMTTLFVKRLAKVRALNKGTEQTVCNEWYV